jgi:hypothetical protein
LSYAVSRRGTKCDEDSPGAPQPNNERRWNLTETTIPRQWRGAIGVFGRKGVLLETVEPAQGPKLPDFSLL